jgi:Penicillin V acylase and related amidases
LIPPVLLTCNLEGALNLAQHIVSSLDIVRGMAVDRDRDGKIIASETTQWSTFRDLTNRVYYFRTYDNFNLRKIDLKRLDFNADKVKTIPMFADKEIIIDLTGQGK